MALQDITFLGQGGSGIPDVLPLALKELQGLRLTVVTGTTAGGDIDVTGIKTTDTIVKVVNLTDLTEVNAVAAKAEKSGVGTGYDEVLEATTAGAAGNAITVALVGDSPGAGGVTIARVGTAFTIHYESGVSTVGDVNTAIDALAGGDDLFGVKTTGTTARTLTAPGHNAAAVALAGGYDAHEDVPTIPSAGHIRFAHVDTSVKKLLVAYFSK